MSQYKYLITMTSQNVYEREVIANNEDEAIDIFLTTLNDSDKISEENFETENITKL